MFKISKFTQHIKMHEKYAKSRFGAPVHLVNRNKNF